MCYALCLEQILLYQFSRLAVHIPEVFRDEILHSLLYCRYAFFNWTDTQKSAGNELNVHYLTRLHWVAVEMRHARLGTMEGNFLTLDRLDA